MVELLAAIPSVIYGLWGIFVVIPILKDVGIWLHRELGFIPLFGTSPVGPGILPAAVVLAIMILPITTSLSRSSLAAVPADLREAALGLGATRWETIFRVMIPAAFSGIAGGVLLALGRAMGETMATTMIIGNSNELSASLLAPGNTIASLIANQFGEAKGLQVSSLMYAALVLMLMTAVVNVFAHRIVASVRRRNQ
jgi:phosphate transport system permease protein